MPSSTAAVLIIVAFVMPGFIASRIVSFTLPGMEPSDGRLVLTSITLSCLNYAVLSPLLVSAWLGKWYENSLAIATLAFCVLFVSPVLTGLAIPQIVESEWGKRTRERFQMMHPVPKAWDYFFRLGTPCWVVATMKDGHVLAGWYGMNSFASSFPAQEDLYLEKTCNLSPEGRILQVRESSQGAIIRMEEVRMLEMFESPSSTPSEEPTR
jgi:Family of unknown function (DUF6338)